MNNSTYISNEYEEVITGPLVESTPGVQLSGFYSSIVDLLTAGNRGQAFTWALNGTDLSTDSAALQQAYDENADAIDDYLQYVDIDKILQKITDPGEEEKYGLDWWRRRIPAALIGAGIGAGIIALIK